MNLGGSKSGSSRRPAPKDGTFDVLVGLGILFVLYWICPPFAVLFNLLVFFLLIAFVVDAFSRSTEERASSDHPVDS